MYYTCPIEERWYVAEKVIQILTDENCYISSDPKLGWLSNIITCGWPCVKNNYCQIIDEVVHNRRMCTLAAWKDFIEGQIDNLFTNRLKDPFTM